LIYPVCVGHFKVEAHIKLPFVTEDQHMYRETPIGPEIIQRQLHYESRALANSGIYLTSVGCLVIWLGFASDFPGNPELRLVLSQGLRIQTWGIHSWCLIEMMATRPLRVAP